MHAKRILALIAAALICMPAALADTHTREDVRAMYRELTLDRAASPYLEKPCVTGEYSQGALTQEAQDDALAYVNFIRDLAYLDGEVELDPVYTLRAQHGATLLAINDELAHDAPQPEGMSDSFYQTAHTATMSSNIAAINWMDDNILITAVEYYVRDDGAINLEDLGHRRWLLNPYMALTGFGLANSETGMSYTVMYAHDLSADPGVWDNVKWPSEGAFPAQLMGYDIPWSVTLDPQVYSGDVSQVRVSMYEQSAGSVEMAYSGVSSASYGVGDCVVFMPDLKKMGIDDYQQNQVWSVRIDGLYTLEGEPASIEYTVEMVSLFPVDPAAVEVEPRALEMKTGDVCLLSAQVVPGWADDTSYAWSSGDETVAVVDENGYVTAVGPGKCEIIASAVNGRSDACAVNVK